MVLDRFRWVYCQLDTLRRCMPLSIWKALNSMPTTLDDTYERMLEGIPKEKFEHASRLFRCMVTAFRPLRVEELAELFAIKFGADNMPSLVAGWRPDNPEEALLSTCSSFITIIDDRDSKIVQFLHFSVKEFLTSDRLQMSNGWNIRQYYVPLEPAHAILAWACVTVLLQVDKNQDEKQFGAYLWGPTPWSTGESTLSLKMWHRELKIRLRICSIPKCRASSHDFWCDALWACLILSIPANLPFSQINQTS